jgi:hypothetical protein
MSLCWGPSIDYVTRMSLRNNLYDITCCPLMKSHECHCHILWHCVVSWWWDANVIVIFCDIMLSLDDVTWMSLSYFVTSCCLLMMSHEWHCHTLWHHVVPWWCHMNVIVILCDIMLSPDAVTRVIDWQFLGAVKMLNVLSFSECFFVTDEPQHLRSTKFKFRCQIF